MSRTWYRVALAREGHEPVVVAASGEHMGVAVETARATLAGSWAVAADVAAATDIVPLGESVGKGAVVQLGPAPAETPRFRFPAGVLPRLGATAALARLGRGFARRADPELLVLEAQTDAANLVDLFLGMIERVPAADNLEIRVLAHFDGDGSAGPGSAAGGRRGSIDGDGSAGPGSAAGGRRGSIVGDDTTDVWLTSRVDAKKVLRFLDEHDRDLIENGHVEINVYARAQKATLRLTEHKTVVWLAEANALAAEVAGWFGELGIPRADELVTVASVPHFHYRPAKSLDRTKLADALFRDRLRRVARLKTA